MTQANTTVTSQQQLDLYRFMLLNRIVEDTMTKLFRQNKIVGGLYSSLGQEAIPVGTVYALERRDWIAPMIRNIGGLLVKGVRPRDIFTQHMARFTSPTQGKDGTSHFGDLKDLHIVSPISMLGDLIPVMTGVAMAGRYLGQNIVALTWIGDGGSSTGAFHEGLNLAAQQRASLVLVIENNQWAYSTPVARQVPIENLADRAKAYGVRAFIVDGNDVEAVFTTAREAVRLCRAGEGPIVIEAKTMRMRGHAQHDPAEYVPKEMFEHWKRRDPIESYERRLTAAGVLTAKKKNEILGAISAVIEEDRAFAENSPFPPPDLAETAIYHEGPLPIEPQWKRPVAEVTPPRSSVKPEWRVSGNGDFQPDIIEGTDSSTAGDVAASAAPRQAVPLTSPAENSGRGFSKGNGAKRSGSKRAAKPAPARGKK
ncbi:MAG TPA: thiamine pyrophosphate-dependent dehydrogenase E1 component subunit alpha [Candidatus Acidoferrales bacterium]|nr:thiamine pyrophosphate-dependent dehydrogenase E1 component subunit alpha [Candidatus Acidoferrales bacterium]